MCNRRQFLEWSTLAVVSGAVTARPLPADDNEGLPDGSASKDMITPGTQEAIDRGLAYLARHQHSDGGFGTFQYHGNVAITSLAALAMMAGGHQAGRGVYSEVVTRALRYVLDQDDGRGYLLSRTGTSHGPMYGHGFGTLFLAEVQGMVQDASLAEKLRVTLQRSVKLIIDSQNSEGSWRYQPGDRIGDISVAICEIMALRAARNAGISVPKSTIDKSIKYVKECQNRDGGFRYQRAGGSSQFARSAAAVVALNCAGIYKGPEIHNGLKYLMQFKPNGPLPARSEVHLHYYYGHYYAAQAMWTAGGRFWAEWFPAIRDELVHQQERQPQLGCWVDHRFSNDYATAMSCIILQIPNNYLPILQK